MKHYIVIIVLRNGTSFKFKNENDPGLLSDHKSTFITFDKNKFRNRITAIRVDEIACFSVQEVEETPIEKCQSPGCDKPQRKNSVFCCFECFAGPLKEARS